MGQDSRVFKVSENFDVEKIMKETAVFLSVQKHMETRSIKTANGYILQARQPKDTWKSISGTRLSTSVQFVHSGVNLRVTIGEGEWTDKIGAGVVGYLVFSPLIVTAAYGAVRQSMLPTEIFTMIKNNLAIADPMPAPALPAEVKPVCPKCGAEAIKGSKFCNKCGTKIVKVCPGCAATYPPETAFCSHCGHKL